MKWNIRLPEGGMQAVIPKELSELDGGQGRILLYYIFVSFVSFHAKKSAQLVEFSVDLSCQ